jgi:hypothetical protein
MSLALGATVAQTVLGLGQTIAGLVKKKPIIPEADIPEEVFQSLTDAEYQAMIGMPPAQRQRAIEDIQRGGATALGRTGERKGGLGMVSRIAQQEAEGYRGLADMDVQARYRNLDRLERARGRMAEERNRAADINRQIAMDERARRDQMIGAGLQNVMGSIGTGSTMAAMFPEQFQGGIFGKLFGRGGDTTPGSIEPGAITQPTGGFIRKNMPYNPMDSFTPQNSLGAVLKR